MRIAALSVLVLALATACAKKVGASHDFSAATAEASATLRELTRTLPSLDAEVERVRGRDPAAAATKVETAIVPLIDHAVTAMDRANEAGRRYLDVADGEDPAALARIRDDLDAVVRRRAAFAGLRDVYVEEARLLHAGPLTAADADRLARRTVDLMASAAR